MLKLTTHISLETIQNCEQLQGMETEKIYDSVPGGATRIKTKIEFELINDDLSIRALPAPTIADVIDNASSLFETKEIKNYKVKKNEQLSFQILAMCMQDKPLKEIEEYIISNLK